MNKGTIYWAVLSIACLAIALGFAVDAFVGIANNGSLIQGEHAVVVAVIAFAASVQFRSQVKLNLAPTQKETTT